MRLNPDLIRDILLVVEDISTVDESVDSDLLISKLPQYDEDSICYHVKQAELSELFTKVVRSWSGAFIIEDLSPAGHRLINEIRNEATWNKTKEVVSKIGNFSLDALKQIASQVAADFLKRQLGY